LCEDNTTKKRSAVCSRCRIEWARGRDVETYLAEQTEKEMVVAKIGSWWYWNDFFAPREDVEKVSPHDTRLLEEELRRIVLELAGAHHVEEAERVASGVGYYGYRAAVVSENAPDSMPGVVRAGSVSKPSSSSGPISSNYIIEKDHIERLQRVNEIVRALMYASRIGGEIDGRRLIYQLSNGALSLEEFGKKDAYLAREMQNFEPEEGGGRDRGRA
jgi:hypothetical protein